MPKFRATLLVATALAGVAACSKTVAVAINIVTVGCAGSPDPFNLDGGVGNSVQFLKFSVTVDGGTVDSQTTAVSSQTLQLPTLPLGTAVINVEGLAGSTSTTPLAIGTSGPFDIPGDGSVSQLSVTVFMRPVNQFSFTNNASTPGTCSTMVSPRAYHSQALLPDGKVLIFGGLQYQADGFDGGVDWTLALAMPPMVVPGTQYWGSAEIYDPQTGQFTSASGLPGGNSSVPAFRSFTQMIAYPNGDAIIVGGESAAANGADELTIPSSNGALYAPTPSPGNWTPIRAGFHDHGCLAVDSNGHPLVAGGYESLSNQVNTTSPTAEYFDPTIFPPVATAVPDIVVSTGSVISFATSRADHACSGFDGVASLFDGLTLEIGGVEMDPTGTYASIDQDYVVYGFQAATADAGATFAPEMQGTSIYGNTLLEPRARAKAAPMIVTKASADGTSTILGDAVLVTGGFTCTPTAGLDGDAGPPCAPVFANGADAGQLGNPPWMYFENDGGAATPTDVGMTTELLGFPLDSNGFNKVIPGTAAADMQVERIDHCAVALPDGRVVVLGGLSGSSAATFGTTNSAEIFSDNSLAPISELPSVQSTPIPNGLLQARAGMACTLLQDGSILVTGGFQTTGPLTGTTQQVTTLNTAEIYRPLPLATADGGV